MYVGFGTLILTLIMVVAFACRGAAAMQYDNHGDIRSWLRCWFCG